MTRQTPRAGLRATTTLLSVFLLCACAKTSGVVDADAGPPPLVLEFSDGGFPTVDGGYDAGTPRDAGNEPRQDGPANAGPAYPHDAGDPILGQAVFRSETFGNEGFWSEAAGLAEGLMEAQVTPRQALELGLHVNAEALDPATRAALVAGLADGGSAGSVLDSYAATLALLNANALIGVVVKDTNLDARRDVASGDQLGITCALCHAVTDGALFQLPGGGGIGGEVDGPPNVALRGGKLLALAKRSRALYPLLQLRFSTLNGSTVGRAPASEALDRSATEQAVDAYLSNESYYPVGTFDVVPDGLGNPTVIPPLLATTRAAPWGHDGSLTGLGDFSNLVFTLSLDPTVLVTPRGKAFLDLLAGIAAKELFDAYAAILNLDLALPGSRFPYVRAERIDVPSGSPEGPAGRRVREQALADLSAYTDALLSPQPVSYDVQAAARGKESFRSLRLACTGCHTVESTGRVPSHVILLTTLWPGYQPVVLLARPTGETRPGSLTVRPLAFSPLQDSPGTYDDRLVMVDASLRGQPRGIALPLLVDLGQRTRFLHDASVTGLEALLDPARGAQSPHPFFVPDAEERRDVAEFLKSVR